MFAQVKKQTVETIKEMTEEELKKMTPWPRRKCAEVVGLIDKSVPATATAYENMNPDEQAVAILEKAGLATDGKRAPSNKSKVKTEETKEVKEEKVSKRSPRNKAAEPPAQETETAGTGSEALLQLQNVLEDYVSKSDARMLAMTSAMEKLEASSAVTQRMLKAVLAGTGLIAEAALEMGPEEYITYAFQQGDAMEDPEGND